MEDSLPSPETDSLKTPLADLDEWEEDVVLRYPKPHVTKKGEEHAFRDYRAEVRPSVKEFYRLNHTLQTFDFVKAKRREFLPLRRRQMNIWEAIEFLDTFVDDSDPDTEMAQSEHLLQTSEEIRRDGHPRWFILAGLIHDLGKILCLFDQPQWAVVGDTFPVGCQFSEKIVFPEFFASNPDSTNPLYREPLGAYQPGCGLDAVLMSWGHDEYLYHVVKDYLPDEALAMIRYHSFYAWHREGEYDYLMDDHDRKMLPWVQKFNPYDLYTKCDERPDAEKLRPFYEDLVAEFFPKQLSW